jgi:alpha-galactosidase
MIRREGEYFVLETAHTSYAFRVLPTGQPEHLYYGKKLPLRGGLETALEPLREKHAFAAGNTNLYDAQHREYSLEDVCLECSALGKGDIREPMLELTHADGSRTSDFVFDKAETQPGKRPFDTLPGSYGADTDVEQLCVTLRDAQYDLTLELYYWVYADCDVITRAARLVNTSNAPVRIERMLSLLVDFDRAGYTVTTFGGAWAREMKRTDTPLRAGRLVNASFTGTSSSRANPFVMLSAPHTTEDGGECYGFNLLYSGNHYEAAEVSAQGKTRFVSGINPQGFDWLLAPGEAFEAPEAVLCYANAGFNALSGRLHTFVRRHIVRGEWQYKPRPVLLNSWEAAYFKIDERRLLRLARAAKEVGVELFVVDDGWFGTRNDDTQALGDWAPNLKKLPGGLKGLCEKIKALGLAFGIWVEPEMVNVNSRLYAAHPNWALQIPGKPHSEGRNQRVLDLTRADVQDWLIETMSGVFASADISYVKWDMNRTFTDLYSSALPAERQGEVAHRYVQGLYRCVRALTEKFPHILFEGCAAGGNRFDLGMLCYFPQIWGSDNTDALCRAEMQTGYSYGYPLSTVGAHLSNCPNHQTLRTTPLETRFNVACFGQLGYECDLCDMSSADRAAIRAQIALYKQWRDVLQAGRFYRGRSFAAGGDGNTILAAQDGNVTEWTCVAADGSRAVGLLLQKNAVPNAPQQRYFARGLDEEATYRFTNRALQYDVREFGDLINTASPVHIRPGGLAHTLAAQFVKMDGETEAYTASGGVLMAGVKLRPAFAAVGYSADVRHWPDGASRLYFMEREVEENEKTAKTQGNPPNAPDGNKEVE